jgi:putative ABC transport system ATP-binding protein
MLIEIADLEAGYRNTPVLHIHHLTIGRGEHTLLLGASGCGKTTLLNVIAGLTAPARGSVRVDGVALETLGGSGRDRLRGGNIGLVMQRLHLISALTVEGNLKLAARLAHRPVERLQIISVLGSLGIAHKRNAYPRALSQGEAQRVAIARAVIHKPLLILADEPTSALDDANANAAIQLLFEQADAHGATLVVATHDARIKTRFARVIEVGAFQKTARETAQKAAAA